MKHLLIFGFLLFTSCHPEREIEELLAKKLNVSQDAVTCDAVNSGSSRFYRCNVWRTGNYECKKINNYVDCYKVDGKEIPAEK